MNNTQYYNLKKPGVNDTADIADINDNMDVVDTTMHNISAHADTNTTSINTLNTQVTNLGNNKQDKTDANLNTDAKTVVGAINELGLIMARRTDTTNKPYFMHPASIDELKDALETIFGQMSNQEATLCVCAPTYNDHSVLGGWAQVCIVMRYDSNTFHATFPSRGVDMYYHDGAWHTYKATMEEVEY